jgi:transposase
MEKIDARTLSQDAQHQIRRQIVKLRQCDMSYAEISDTVGVSLSYACRVYKRYEREGMQGISKGQRGRRTGQQRTLGTEQEAAVRKTIQDRTPHQLKLPFALWTRQAVQELINRQHGIKMPIRTVGEYLMRWGFTLQKPIRKAYEQRPSALRNGLRSSIPR